MWEVTLHSCTKLIMFCTGTYWKTEDCGGGGINMAVYHSFNKRIQIPTCTQTISVICDNIQKLTQTKITVLLEKKNYIFFNLNFYFNSV
jgi:hypothetical protein